MEIRTDIPWLADLVISSAVAKAGRASQFYRAVEKGEFTRLAHGLYVPTRIWTNLSYDEKYLAKVHGAARVVRPGLVFSHRSAAALWRLPTVGAWPDRPEAIVGVKPAGAVRRAFTARQFPLPNRVDRIDGVTVTPLSRTLVDVATVAQLSTSVAMLDRATAARDPRDRTRIAFTTPAEVWNEFEQLQPRRGRSRCVAAIELADGASGSPGESVSRVGFHLLGLPMPLLQYAFYDALGLIGYVDFWWPEFNLIGEFDGFGKYLRHELLRGQSTADAVLLEKKREDRLRALGPKVTRWGWDVARSLPLLADHLRDAGLR